MRAEGRVRRVRSDGKEVEVAEGEERGRKVRNIKVQV